MMRLIRMLFVAVFLTVAWAALRWEEVEAPVWLLLSGGGRPATFVVSAGGCTSSSLGPGYRCEADGVTDEGAAMLRFQSLEPVRFPIGEERQVLSTILVNDVPRVVPQVDDWQSWALDQAEPTLRWLRLGLMVLVGLHVLDLLGSLIRVWGGGRVQFRVAASAPGCGGFLIGLGLPLVLGASTRIGTELGPPILWGLAFVGLALLMPVERFVIFNRREVTITKGIRYLILPIPYRSVAAGQFQRVVIEMRQQATVVSVSTSNAGRVEIVQSHSSPQALELARKISQALGVKLQDGKTRLRDQRPETTHEVGSEAPAPSAAAARPSPAGQPAVMMAGELPSASADGAADPGLPKVTVVGDGPGLERIAPFLGCGCLVILAVLGLLVVMGVIDLGALRAMTQ